MNSRDGHRCHKHPEMTHKMCFPKCNFEIRSHSFHYIYILNIIMTPPKTVKNLVHSSLHLFIQFIQQTLLNPDDLETGEIRHPPLPHSLQVGQSVHRLALPRGLLGQQNIKPFQNMGSAGHSQLLCVSPIPFPSTPLPPCLSSFLLSTNT